MMLPFVSHIDRAWRRQLLQALLLLSVMLAGSAWAEDPEPNFAFRTPGGMSNLESLETMPIDLAGAFALIGVRNPEFLAAQQRVLEASALRQLAAVQLLPTINLGMNLDSHTGNLQQSNGNILKVNRQALFVGAGANAIAAGTVSIPGVVWNLNLSETYFNILISRQVEAQRIANTSAVNNNVLLQIASAYLELVRAAGHKSIHWQARQDLAEVARITANFSRFGQGRLADAERAATELHSRDGDLIQTEGQIVRASAALAALVGLDTAVRLVPMDQWAVPHSIVPEPIPLPELITIAALRRPELAEQRADLERTLLGLQSARLLPFSPNVFVGFSAGTFGGGSNLATQPVGSSPFGSDQARFGNFQSRTDLDAVVYWSLRNLGVGNQAQIAASGSRVRQSEWQLLMLMDRVRADVARAYVRVHARFHQLATAEDAVREADTAWHQDLERIKANDGLPIEVLDSQRLLIRSRMAYLNTIVNYNLAQFELYHALGQPQADWLVRENTAEEEDEPLPPPP